jgi:hypothetical protein
MRSARIRPVPTRPRLPSRCWLGIDGLVQWENTSRLVEATEAGDECEGDEGP